MPIPPLHLGLGATIKIIAPHKFSFLIFAGTQVLMDIEPLLGIVFKWDTLHFYSHNLMGALLIGMFAIFIGKPISAFTLNCLFKKPDWKISWQVASLSAFIGSFSHVLFDGLMHTDMYPFFPFSTTQTLLTLVPYTYIFYTCLASFIIAGIGFLMRKSSD